MLDITFILWIIGCAIVLIAVKVSYMFVIKPKRLIKKYVQHNKNNNWKVLNLGFIPFDTKIRSITQGSAKTHEDCHFQLKNQWSQYDVVVCNFVDRPYIQLVNPQLAKQFYEKESEKTFRKYTVLIRQLQRMVGKSITFSQGTRWKNKRKVMIQFLNFSFVKSVNQKIQTICEREMEIFFQKNILPNETRGSKQVSQIHIQEMIEMINSTVIAEIFFGGGNEKVDSIQIDGKGLPHFMRDLMEELFKETINPLSVILGAKFVELGIREMDRKCNNLLKKFRQFVTNFVHNRLYEIQQKISKGIQIKQPNDLIEAFYLQVGIQKITANKKDFIDNMIDDFANLYTAGTDTTQHATMMTIYYIHKYPEVKKKLLQNIEKCKNTEGKLQTDSVKNLIYLEAVCFETLRMYQTANGIFPREVLEEVTIGGVKYNKDTVIATQTFPVHYKGQIYQQPKQYKPQRWIDNEGKMKSPQPYCFNTFSHGIRSCIGKQLALQEIKMFVVNFCTKFDCEFETLDFRFNMHGFAYEPQNIKMKFWKK